MRSRANRSAPPADVRVYVPATLRLLAEWREAGEVGPAPLDVHAVTPALREWYVAGDLEELEYAAMTGAARASLRLLAADRDAARRRVVVALDVPEGDWSPTGAGGDLSLRSLSRLSAGAAWSGVAAVHADDERATDVVVAAVDALVAAANGDPDAQFVVDTAESVELQWWATQEVPDLLAGA